MKAKAQAKAQPVDTTLDRYLGLPYHMTLVRDGDGNGAGWVAGVEELPGCTSQGATPDEAVNGIQQAMAAWITGALQEGRDVPEPKTVEEHSGRLLLRMPRTLHAELTRIAEREGVSLNQFITDALSSAVGWRLPGRERSANGSADEKTSINQVPGAAALTPEQEAGPESADSRSRRFLMAILTANFVFVALAALVAILILIAAWL